MTARVPCPPAPGPLEAYAACFDHLFSSLAQRRGFREYLTGLLAPRDRNKTLTCLAGAEPITQAQHPAVQRLQVFRVHLGSECDQRSAAGAAAGRPSNRPACAGGAGHRRFRSSQVRHDHRARGTPVAGPLGQDRGLRGHGDHAVG
jgi:hypothetical protein